MLCRGLLFDDERDDRQRRQGRDEGDIEDDADVHLQGVQEEHDGNRADESSSILAKCFEPEPTSSIPCTERGRNDRITRRRASTRAQSIENASPSTPCQMDDSFIGGLATAL